MTKSDGLDQICRFFLIGWMQIHPNGGCPNHGPRDKVRPTAVTVLIRRSFADIRPTSTRSNDVPQGTFQSHLRVAFFCLNCLAILKFAMVRICTLRVSCGKASGATKDFMQQFRATRSIQIFGSQFSSPKFLFKNQTALEEPQYPLRRNVDQTTGMAQRALALETRGAVEHRLVGDIVFQPDHMGFVA